MTGQLPDPLTPAEADLRGLEWMPLFGDRLIGSETWISASSEGKVAALRLWWRSYAKEKPAASLPSSDKLLAEYAGYGVAIRAWLKIKDEVMRGFVLCSDGRWYHPFLATEAIKAWEERNAYFQARESDRERLKRWRANKKKKSETGGETVSATPTETPELPLETRSVRSKTGQDRTGQDSKKIKGADAPSPKEIFEAPDWLPADPWAAFKEMRQRIRKPMTVRAMRLIAADLQRLRLKGFDPGKVLLQSVKNSWQGVFELKGDQHEGTRSSYGNGGTKTDRLRAAASRAAVNGGFAPPGSGRQANVDDDAVSVFPDPSPLREGA